MALVTHTKGTKVSGLVHTSVGHASSSFQIQRLKLLLEASEKRFACPPSSALLVSVGRRDERAIS